MPVECDMQTEKFLLQLEKISKAAKPEIFKILEEAARETVEAARSIVPVDTGRLQASIIVKDLNLFELKAELGAYCPYAAYVEFGTAKIKTQPFWFGNVYFYVEEMRKRLKEVFKLG